MKKNNDILMYNKIMNELNLMKSDPLLLKYNFQLLAKICYKYDIYVRLKEDLKNAEYVLAQYHIYKSSKSPISNNYTRRDIPFESAIYAGIFQIAFEKNNLGYSWDEVTGHISNTNGCKDAGKDFIKRSFDISEETQAEFHEAVESIYYNNNNKNKYENIQDAISIVKKCKRALSRKYSINSKKMNDSLTKYIREDVLESLYQNLIIKNYAYFFFDITIPRILLSRTDKENKKAKANISNIRRRYFNTKMQPINHIENYLRDTIEKLEPYVKVYNNVHKQIEYHE